MDEKLLSIANVEFYIFIFAVLFSCSSPISNRPLKNVPETSRVLSNANDHLTMDKDYEYAYKFDKFLQKEMSKVEESELINNCQKSPVENKFCFSVVNYHYFEEKTKIRKEKLIASKAKSKPVRIIFKKNSVNNWSEVRYAPINASIKKVATLNKNKLTILKNLALKETNCPNNVAIAIAAHLEDKLPDTKVAHEVAELYKKGGKCLISIPSDWVITLTRSALFYFWLGDYKNAKEILLELAKAQNAFIARSLYWLYRLYIKENNKDSASLTLNLLNNSYPFAFHTLVALISKGQDPGDILLRRRFDGQHKRTQKMPLLNLLIDQVESLNKMGFEKSASIVLDWAITESQGVEPEFKIYLAELKRDQGDYFSKISLLTDVLYKNPSLVSKETMEMYFPKVFFPLFEKQSKIIDPYLLLSIARRESAFDVKAISSSNAQGLLQILPQVKKELTLYKDLMNPTDNIEIGANYITKLLSELKGQIHLALAAYNAGPQKLKSWIQRYPVSDPILFIDLMPYRETREYVASILRNYYWYRRIHERNEGITTHELLELLISKSS